MQLLHHPSPRAGPGRRLGRTLISGTLVAVGLAAAGCGAGGGGDATILNTEKVERAIEQSSLAQRGQHAHVSCPAGVHQKKGLTFACTAVVGQATTRFSVTQLDGSGRVHYVAR
jgi:hypothetical protein